MNRCEFIGSAAATLAAGCVDVNPAAKGAAEAVALPGESAAKPYVAGTYHIER